MDLLCWLADCLFCLLDDQKFRKFLEPQQFANMNPYLHSKNEIALHMILSSSIRGLLSAVCRRMNHLHGISVRAISYYESRSTAGSNDPKSGPGQALHQAYLKMQRNSSSNLIDVSKFDELLTLLGKNIRQQYNDSFAEMGKRTAAEAAKRNPNAGKNVAEEAIKRAQTHCELTMLLAGSPPLTLAPVIQRFFNNDLAEFRSKCNPAELFFANYDLLEVDDEPKVLAARRQRGVRVDLFKRVEIFHRKRSAGAGSDEEPLPWRRCVRCASVMEDAITVGKPGFLFVLSQQRNCCCGGRLAILGKDELVG